MRAERVAWTGQSLPRVEDAALLSGHGRFIDDLAVRPGTLHAAILRSSHAHADILNIDVTAAAAHPGVVAVITGKDVAALTTPMVAGLKVAAENWPIAVSMTASSIRVSMIAVPTQTAGKPITRLR